jgi:outer membrane protein TolC
LPPLSAQTGETPSKLPAPFRSASSIWRPYQFRAEPPANLGNSNRIEALLRAGRVYLSLQDAIALALENNLDIELQRYGPRLASTDLLRAQSGSAIRGVSSSVAGATGASSSVGAVTTGTGVVAMSLEPTATFNYNWLHQTTPQTSSFVTGTNSLQTESNTANFGLQKGFLTGTAVSFGWNNSFVSNNSGRSDFNPSKSANFSLSVTQHLLEGFGRAVNNRNIRIARNNLQVSDLVFRQQVMTTVASVINLYWDLVSYTQNVNVQRQAVALAQRLYEDNKKQVEIGTLAPIEIVRAEAQVASSQQSLTIAETQLLQQETVLKNVLSRTGVASPSLAEAHVVPTDQIRVPASEAIEPVQDLVARAMENRPELAQTRVQVENAKIGLAGTKNAMRPTLDLVGTLQNNGLAGQVNTLPVPSVIPGAPPTPRNPDAVSPYFLGGYGTALAQMFRRNFPNYSLGFQLNVPLGNKVAEADMIRDQLAIRQQEIRQQQLVNQIRLDVTNALIAVQQARAQFESATKSRVLQEQTLAAEEKKYALGASTIYFVIQAQRDLAQAQSQEVTALSAYSRAKVSLDQATGRILDTYAIQIDEAKSGRVARGPSPLPPESQP